MFYKTSKQKLSIGHFDHFIGSSIINLGAADFAKTTNSKKKTSEKGTFCKTSKEKLSIGHFDHFIGSSIINLGAVDFA